MIDDMRCDLCGRDVAQAGRSGPGRYELRCPTCPDHERDAPEQMDLFA